MWVCAGLCDVDNVLKQIDLLSCFKAFLSCIYIEETFIFRFVLLETGLWVWSYIIDGTLAFRPKEIFFEWNEFLCDLLLVYFTEHT